MRCDEMISSHHRSDHQVDILVGWKMKMWTQKKRTDGSWLDWKGMLSDKRRGRGYCCCCCIKWMKRMRILPLLLLYKRSGRGVQEEVLAFFYSGWRGRRYCRCCWIKWMKRKRILPLLLLYKRRGSGVQEEVLACFCSGRRGRGGGVLSTSRLRLDRWGRRHGRKLLTADKHTPLQF